MFLLLQILILLGLCFTVVVFKLRMRYWVPLFIAVLIAMSYWLTPPAGLLVVAWIILGGIVVFFGMAPVRQVLISAPIMARVRKTLPPMSETEKIALEAGDVWWEADLFAGSPDWNKLLQKQLPGLTEEEQSFLDNQVETLCSMLNDYEIIQQGDLPQAVWNYLKKEGFFGLVISKEYGGKGFSAIAHSTMVVKMASRSLSTAVNAMVPNSLGPGELLTHYGTDEQKKYYLPRLARGEEIPCFGLTAPEAGSDATAIPDEGIICRGQFEGKEVLGIRLNFDKRYITLAPVATVIGVAFKLFDPDHLLGQQEELGITLCLVPSTLPGVEQGKRHSPMGIAFMNGPVRGKDVFIPLDYIIGGKAMIGEGWRMLMECLSIGRSISLPALSAASAKLSYRATGAYARIRKQFKLPIGRFEGVEEFLSRIAGFNYLIEGCRRLTAAAVDCGVRPSLASAIAKYHMTELARKIVDDAMDVHGGKGIQLGPNNYLGLVYQGIPISITVEGANILTRNLIIFGQGAMRCHPFVQKEIAAASSEKGLKVFDQLLLAHIGYFFRNWIVLKTRGWASGQFQLFRKNKMGVYYRRLTTFSSALAVVSDITLFMLGGALKRKERLSARLGDVLSYLYLASSALKYFEDLGAPKEDEAVITWALQFCLTQIQIAFKEFFNNFPQKWVGHLLKFLVFPFGRSYAMPSDKLSQDLATQMLMPSQFRDRLTKECYRSNVLKKLDEALEKVIAVEALEKKQRSEPLSAAEKAEINEAANLVKQVIAVDEF